MMDDMTWLRLVGFLGPALDWAAILAFLVIAVVYWLVPLAGYRPEKRGMLLAALYVLVGHVALSLLQYLVQYVQFLQRSGGGSTPSLYAHAYIGLAIIRTMVFVLAMLLFVIGLQSLHLNRHPLDRDD
jgi:hypothetical protein